MKLGTLMQTLRAPGMTLTKSYKYYVRPWINHARPYQPNKLIRTEPTLAHARASYTLTAEAKLIQITIILYTQRVTGIQHTLLIW